MTKQLFILFLFFSAVAFGQESVVEKVVKQTVTQKTCICDGVEIIEEVIEEVIEVPVELPLWRASTELGIINTKGNSNATLGKLKANIYVETEAFRNTFEFDSLYKKDEVERSYTDDEGNVEKKDVKETTENKFNIAYQTNYKMEDKNQAVFGRISFEQNKFSSYNYQSSISIGYNTRLLRSDRSFLDVSIGPGFAFDSVAEERIDEVTNETKTVDKTQQNLLLFTSALYERQLSDSSYFSQSITIEASEVNVKTVMETAVSATISGALALKASIKIDHNTEVEQDFEETDTVTGVTIVYTW